MEGSVITQSTLKRKPATPASSPKIDWEKVLMKSTKEKVIVPSTMKAPVSHTKEVASVTNTKEKQVNDVSKQNIDSSIRDTTDKPLTSNNIKDNVRVRCKICEKAIVMYNMQGHTKNVHYLSLEQYSNFYGDWKSTIVMPIYHKCKIANCKESFLVDLSELAIHLKTHTEENTLKPKEYIKRFMSEKTELIKQTIKKSPAKGKNVVKKEVASPIPEANKVKSKPQDAQESATASVQPIKEPQPPTSFPEDSGSRKPFGEIPVNVQNTIKPVNVSMKKLSPKELVVNEQVEVFESSALKVSKTVSSDISLSTKATKMKVTECLKRKLEEDNEIESIHKKIKEKRSLSAEELLLAIDSLLD